MAFRRNFEAASTSDMRRKILLLIGCLILLPLLVYLIQHQYTKKPTQVELEMLSNNFYIVENKTSNFETLAHKLREVHQKASTTKEGYNIKVAIAPTVSNTDTLQAVIQIINALDVPYTIKNNTNVNK